MKGKGPTDRGDWRLFNDRIDFLAEKNLGFDGGVEKTLGCQFVNTLSDVPASMNRECRGCWHGHYYALRGAGYSLHGGHRIFFFWGGGGPLFVFSARARSF